jgi:hypothetical protein
MAIAITVACLNHDEGWRNRLQKKWPRRCTTSMVWRHQHLTLQSDASHVQCGLIFRVEEAHELSHDVLFRSQGDITGQKKAATIGILDPEHTGEIVA